MPSNIIRINGSQVLTWIVPDSQMEKVIEVLNKYGDKDDEITSDAFPLPCSQTDCQA